MKAVVTQFPLALRLVHWLMAVLVIAMLFIGPSGYWLGAGLFILANVAFGASIVFYNSYLPSIASEDQRDHVSASGFAMGYLGGGLLLVLNLILFLFGGKLGLTSALVARISLASAGFWWLGFSVITFRSLRARHAVRPLPAGDNYLTIGFRQLARLLQAPRSDNSGPDAPLSQEYWEAVLRDFRADGKPWLSVQQMRLSEIPRELLRVECASPSYSPEGA